MVDDIERGLLGLVTNMDDPGYTHPYFVATGFSNFEDIFPNSLSCYEIANEIRAAKVVTKAVMEDHEYSCCYYNFKTKRSAESFCKRLAKFLAKKRG